jgi:hypothetical protein
VKKIKIKIKTWGFHTLFPSLVDHMQLDPSLTDTFYLTSNDSFLCSLLFSSLRSTPYLYSVQALVSPDYWTWTRPYSYIAASPASQRLRLFLAVFYTALTGPGRSGDPWSTLRWLVVDGVSNTATLPKALRYHPPQPLVKIEYGVIGLFLRPTSYDIHPWLL